MLALQFLPPCILLLCIRAEYPVNRATETKSENSTVTSFQHSFNDSTTNQSSTGVPDLELNTGANLSKGSYDLENVSSLPDKNNSRTNRLKGNEVYSESPTISNLKTTLLNDFNTTEILELKSNLDNSTVDHGPTNPLYSELTSFKNTSSDSNLNQSKSTVLSPTESTLTLKQLELLGRNFKYMLVPRTSSQQTEIDDGLPDDEPFGSAIWRDKKYLSVMIPIGVGITGAMIIIVMTFASKICKKNSNENRTPAIPKIFTQSTATANKSDDIILLNDTSDEEF